MSFRACLLGDISQNHANMKMLNDEYIMLGVTAKPGFPHPNSTTQGVVVEK